MPGVFTSLSGEVFFVVNPAGMAEVLKGSSGPVARHMLRDGEKVKVAAIAIAPRGKTQQLSAHIVKRLVQNADGGVACIVGIDGNQVRYAYWVHEGAAPHDIYPRKAPRLVFFSQKLGKTIFMPVGAPVHHPGNKPNRFLLRALSVLHD